MKHILGKDRNQIEILSLNELIAQDNEVRTIDLFVDSLSFFAVLGLIKEILSPFHISTSKLKI